MKLTEIFVLCGLCKSKSEARQIAKQGGLYIDDPLGVAETYRVEEDDELFPQLSIKVDGQEQSQPNVVDVPQFRDDKNKRILFKLRRGKNQIQFFAVTDE